MTPEIRHAPKRRSLALLTFVLATLPMLAAAQGAFPSRPLQVIVPFAAGGGLDQNARAFSQALSEALRQPVAVMNRDGAAGTIGLADGFGMPVSTTHVLSSGVAGTMWANRSGIQGGTVREIALAWILTLPATVLLAGAIYGVATLLTG